MTASVRPHRPGPVVAADPRRAAKARAGRADRRRRRWHRLLIVLLVAVPAAGLGWLVLLSPVLGVGQVQVTGTARLTPAQVVAAARMVPGTPLARVSVGDVAERVERALPPVQDVRVRRVWPRTLELDVVERTAAAAVVRPDGVLLVSADGVGFATVPAPPAGVPRLELARPAPDDPATRAALAVLRELPADLRSRTAVVRATTGADVQLGLADGRTVVWGDPGDGPAKAQALTALLRLPGTVYDVSAPGLVVRR